MEIELKLYNPALFDNWIDSFDINSISKETRKSMFKSYANDYILFREWYEPEDTIEDALAEPPGPKVRHHPKRVVPVIELTSDITGHLTGIQREQFKTLNINGLADDVSTGELPFFWIQPISVMFPNIDYNLQIMDMEMTDAGYVRTRLSSKRSLDNESWYFAVYNPDPELMPDIKHRLMKTTLIHYSPEFNHDDIMKTGLIPSHGGRTYTYPDKRVFFYVHSTVEDFDESYHKMLSGIARKIKKENRLFSGIFRCYILDIKRLPEDVKIMYDPNAKNCIYVNSHIPLELLTYLPDEDLEF